MATIAPATTILEIAPGNFKYTTIWPNMAGGDVGAPIFIANQPQFVDHTFDYSGLTDTESFRWEGSPDGGVFAALDERTPYGGMFTTYAGPWPSWIRPHVTAGSGTTSITARAIVNRTTKEQ